MYKPNNNDNTVSHQQELDTAYVLAQATRLHKILVWIKQCIACRQRIDRLKQGIDTELYDSAKQQQKLEKLQARNDMQLYLNLADLGYRTKVLEEERSHHMTIALKQSKTDEERSQSAFKAEELTDQYKPLEKEYEQKLNQIVPELYERLPTLYSKIIGGTNMDTVRHVLVTMKLYQDGKISTNEAANRGIDYEESRGGPKGILDVLLEGPRRKRK